MAIKIVIRRRIPKAKETQALPLLLELRSKAIIQAGYISGKTLRNIYDMEDYVFLSTWKSVNHWKVWEASMERKEIQGKIKNLLGDKDTFNAYFYR